MEILGSSGRFYHKYHINKLAISVLISSILISFSTYYFLQQHEANQIDYVLTQSSILLKKSLEKEITNNIRLVEDISKKWQQDHGRNYNMWLLAAGQVVALNPNIQAIQWVDHNFNVRWVQPIENNNQNLNYNLSNDKKINQLLTYSRDNKITMISDIVTLEHEGKGILSVSPMYNDLAFSGFIIGLYPINALLKSVLNEGIFDDYFIKISENSATFYSSGSKHKTREFLDKLTKTQSLKISNNPWDVQLTPSKALVLSLQSNLPQLVLIISLIFSTLLSLLIFYLQLFKRTNNQLLLLKNSVKSISDNSEFSIIIKECITLLSESLNWEMAHAYLVHPHHKNQLVPSNIWYLSDKQKFHDFRKVMAHKYYTNNQGIPGLVLSNKSTTWLNNPKELKSIICNEPEMFMIKSAMGFPIKYKRNIKVVLVFYHTKKTDYDNSILELINTLSQELSYAYSRKQLENLWQRLALKDGLTHFMNFKQFCTKIDESLFLAKLYNEKIAVVTVHIDNLKQINDQFGFIIGNETLKTISDIVIHRLKSTSYIARYTGKKFGILLTNVPNEEYVISIIKDLYFALSHTIQIRDYCINLKVKIGYEISNPNINTEKLIKQSDPLSSNNKVYTESLE